jgi:hypothetical protein
MQDGDELDPQADVDFYCELMDETRREIAGREFETYAAWWRELRGQMAAMNERRGRALELMIRMLGDSHD